MGGYFRLRSSVCVPVRFYSEGVVCRIFKIHWWQLGIPHLSLCSFIAYIIFFFLNYSINQFRNICYLFITDPPECRNVLQQMYRVCLDNTDTLLGRVGGLKIYSTNLLRIVLVASSLRVERNAVAAVQFATIPAPFSLSVGLVYRSTWLVSPH